MGHKGRWQEPTDRTARDEYRTLRRELKLSRTAKARRTEIENRLDEICPTGSKEPSSQIREPRPGTADNLALVARVEAARKTVPAVFPVFNLDPAVGRQRAIKRAKTATPAEKAVAILADVPNHPLNRLAAEVAHWLWSEDKSNPKPPAATLAAQYVRHWLSDEPWNRHDVRGSRLTVDAAVANAFRLVAEQEAMEPGWFVRRAETFAWLDKHYTENVNGYLFTNSKGKPYLSDNVVKYGVHRAMVKLGIQTAKGVHVGIHCFRHGVTSELLESGTPIHVVTRLMRHADSHVTLEHYAHIVGDAERVASEKFSQRIGQNITQLESDSELESTSSVKTA